METSNVVRGRVVVVPSGRGVTGLVVEAYDVPAGSSRERNEGDAKKEWRRLGSAETSDKGEFSITYALPTPSKEAKAPEVSLVITVSVPDRSDKARDPVYVAHKPRVRPGKLEVYLISLSEDELEKAGGVPVKTPPEGDPEPAALMRNRLKLEAERAVEAQRAQVEARRLSVALARETVATFESELKPALERALSAVSEAQATSATFVPRGGSVTMASERVIGADLPGVINNEAGRAAMRTRVVLTEAQLAELRSRLDGNNEVTAAVLAEILGTAPGAPSSVLREDPTAIVCRELSRQERDVASALGSAQEEDEEEDDEDEESDVAGNNIDVLDEGDVRRYLARLISTMTTPEEAVVTGLEPRATQSTVGTGVQELSFRPSPADTTRYHDFHNLQVAFRHVWQEAIDEGILTLAEAAYDEIVDAGGQPKVLPLQHPVSALTKEAKIVQRAASQTMMTMAKPAGGVTGNTSSPGGNTGGNTWTGISTGLMGTDNVFNPPNEEETLPGLLNELNQRMQEPYAFTTFAANRQHRSVNFGIRVTYQQKWQPLEYQAGRLAKTITLAPKEVRKYTKTVKRSRKRSEKEVEKHVSIRKEELTQTARVEQEVIRKANTKTHFDIGAEMNAGVEGGPSSTMKTSFDHEAAQTSENVKKSFNESVRKAVQELTDEVSVELNREELDEYEESESGEIANPNDELAVTFLFYELQRRYRISEHIHRISPVVLVAQEMPAPHEINEAWLVSHDWILRRVLLDDSFAPALAYLSSKVVGDQVALGEMKKNIAQQRQAIQDLKQQITIVRQRAATQRTLLEQSILKSAKKDSGGDDSWFSGIPVIGDAVDLAEDAIQAVGDFIHPDMPEVGSSREDALKETIQRTVDEERDLLMRIEREVTALNALTESYAKSLADNYNQRTQILRLRTHIKQNILYYMQAIWSHEPPDQRYLRLHETPVPTFGGERRFRFTSLDPVPGAMSSLAHRGIDSPDTPARAIYEADVVCELDAQAPMPLSRVADLDDLLGYFGNYMIFRLKESNALTDFMMAPYLLQGFGELVDPDDLGNWSLEQFVDYVACLAERLPVETFDRIRAELKAQYDRLITAPRRNGDVVTIPTGSLFIEALPATSSLIERFKAIHRAIDVKKAQAEARHAEIKNLWMVDRLVHNEREDPEIDKKVVITGVTTPPVVPVEE